LLTRLSETEVFQLGKPKVLRGTKQSNYTVIPASHWRRTRNLLLALSQMRCPNLNAELTAYTPGETLCLLKHPIIESWHRRVSEFVIPTDSTGN